MLTETDTKIFGIASLLSENDSVAEGYRYSTTSYT